MNSPQTTEKRAYRPYVPASVKMNEFTFRAVLLGLVMTAVLGAANAYLGPQGRHDHCRHVPRRGHRHGRAAADEGLHPGREHGPVPWGPSGNPWPRGAIFTIPAFVLAGVWPTFSIGEAYWKSTVLMLVGGILGILFVTLLRRVMVEDPEMPFPESVAAGEIHKAGQGGSQAAGLLFRAMAFGAGVFFLGAIRLFAVGKDFVVHIGQLGHSAVRLGSAKSAPTIGVGGVSTFSAPAISPAYLGVGYIIGPRLAALNFSGGVIAWGLMVPLIIYLMGPRLETLMPPGAGEGGWDAMAQSVWRFIVRPIAVGGMLVGACYTLFRMRANLAVGIKRAVSDLKKSGSQVETTDRTQRDLSAKTVFAGLFVTFLCMVAIYYYFAGVFSGAVVAAVVMLILGFFFAAVSGNLVGLIGSSNNPVSGLTLSTLIIAALLMVSIGVSGLNGVSAVLGVAAVICVSSAVAGEMLQDLKVGHILGGTPRSMQIGDILGILVASAVLYFPLFVLHAGNIKAGGVGFGDRQLPAPQAGLMAALAQGIVGGDMAWPLVVVGIFMGLALILLQVRSPMLFAVGMYLPLETTFAIFLGGVFRWVTDVLRDRRGFNEAQRARVENAGVLTASGLIAGEALTGLLVAACRFFEWPVKAGNGATPGLPTIFASPSILAGFVVLAVIALVMIFIPLRNAGHPDEPAPPTAIM